MSEAGAEGLVAELRLAERIFKEDADDQAACSAGGLFGRAAAALEANARALAEAGAEIERLRKERDHWKFGHDASERQRDEALEALRPFASISDLIDSETEGFSDTDNLNMFVDESDYLLDRIKVGAFRAARSVLENSKAGLADATPKKSPSSQDQEIAGLREEVRRKDEALRNVRGLIDTPVARRKHHNDPFYDDVIASLRTALSPLDGEA